LLFLSCAIAGGVGLISEKQRCLFIAWNNDAEKRDYFIQLMKDTRFELLDSKGSYFICGKYDRISDEKDSEFAIRITKEYGVAVIPVSVFYKNETDNKVVRFCFCKKEETLESAVERLIKI
jgi:methionine aminotransferase